MLSLLVGGNASLDVAGVPAPLPRTPSPPLRDLLPSGVPAAEAADSNAIMTPRTGDLVSSRRVTDWQARGPD